MKPAILFVFLFLHSVTIAQSVLTGKVVKVADGDTLTILTANNSQVRVRLHGIDCPEKGQDFGNKAKQYTSALSIGKVIKVQVINKDRYGRTIGRVFLPDGRMLNKELLKAGLAWHYTKFDKSADFAALEISARQRRIGLWSIPNHTPPWDFRKRKVGS